jgi:hypothetical protein
MKVYERMIIGKGMEGWSMRTGLFIEVSFCLGKQMVKEVLAIRMGLNM